MREFPKYNKNYRVSFEWVEPDNPIFETTKKLVIVEGKIEKALEVVNSYSTPTPNFLEFLVPIQDEVGCAETDCSYVIDNVKFSPLFICLFGPKGEIALSDFEFESDSAKPWSEPLAAEPLTPEPITASGVFHHFGSLNKVKGYSDASEVGGISANHPEDN
uniref:Uncharacterized protein n=1 Tax=Caenorhabditis japonica TaxID=281687 RepID=A0A8R1HKB9_CAEJA